MKKILLLFMVFSAFVLTSCSSDDNNTGGNQFPQIVNIKYEITTTRNSDAIVNRKLNNETQTGNVASLPYSFTYSQQEVNQDTYLKLSFQDNGIYQVTEEGSSWTDYNAELKISIGNNVVKTQLFEITEGVGIVQVDYIIEY